MSCAGCNELADMLRDMTRRYDETLRELWAERERARLLERELHETMHQLCSPAESELPF